MKLSRISGLLSAGALLVATTVTACGDDGSDVVASGTCSTGADCPEGRICVDKVCVDQGTTDDVGATLDVAEELPDIAVVEDTPEPGPDLPAPKDINVVPDPGPAPELLPDKQAPTLVSTTPKDAAAGVEVPWTFEMTFSEPVKNIEENTVQVTDALGNVLKGSFTSDDTQSIWTFTPSTALQAASPYRAKINFELQVIADMANNKMVGIPEVQFFTAPPKNREKYADLAAQFAPRLRVLTSDKPHYDYPAKFDLDGNQDLKDNKAYLDKATTKQLTPVVYWDAIESESHYYLHYVWYHVGRTIEGDTFENEAAGVLVVVEKFPEPRPVEALAWFKKVGGDYIRAFATTEANVSGGGNLANLGLSAEYAQADLFKDGHVEVAITGGGHEACVWLHEGNNSACDLPLADRVQYEATTVILDAGATPSTIKKNGSSWPRSNQAIAGTVGGTVSYKLEDMLALWWPYRTQVGTRFYDSFATYSFQANGKSAKVELPRYFVKADGTESDGRVPWAVIWEPGDLSQYVQDLPAGQFFLEPAAHLAARHKTTYTTTAFDAVAKTGFSTAWCFNAYLGIDIRGTGDACPL